MRLATERDISYLDSLQLRETNCVGFLPAQIWGPATIAGRVLVVTINDEPAGYLLRGPWRPITKIYQCVIQEDARRITNGQALVAHLRAEANRHQVERISLHCAEDLDANNFWPAIGFQWAGRRPGRLARGREHNRYQIDLAHHYEMTRRLAAELHGDKTLRILDLIGVKEQFLTPVRKRLRART